MKNTHNPHLQHYTDSEKVDFDWESSEHGEVVCKGTLHTLLPLWPVIFDTISLKEFLAASSQRTRTLFKKLRNIGGDLRPVAAHRLLSRGVGGQAGGVCPRRCSGLDQRRNAEHAARQAGFPGGRRAAEMQSGCPGARFPSGPAAPQGHRPARLPALRLCPLGEGSARPGSSCRYPLASCSKRRALLLSHVKPYG